jgi:hypothetical protein
VLEEILRRFGARQTPQGIEVNYAIKLYQVLPGPAYRIWNVFKAWSCPTDIAVLHLGLDGSSDGASKVAWKQPILRAMPPPVGQKIVAFGYRESTIIVREDAEGTYHIELNDKPTTSAGEITQIFPDGRDKVMLPFPCFEIRARFDSGMSGGLVIDEEGALCGLICASLQQSDPEQPPISYVATLWPMLTTVVSADRGDAYPRGVEYPLIDLAIDKIMGVKDLASLDPSRFPGMELK